MSEKNICPHCAKEFVKENPCQKYCAFSCAQASKNKKRHEPVELICDYCSKPHLVPKSRAKYLVENNICKECKRSSSSKNQIHARQCLRCGKDFRGESSPSKFCSTACLVESKKRPIVEFKKNTKEPPSLMKFAGKMPCNECSFGKRSIHSETGWECLANARVCAPFTYKKLFRPKQSMEAVLNV